MRMTSAALAAVLALAGCVASPGPETGGAEDLPPGYPPKMGALTGTLAGAPAEWQTYDFSIGAFDASAQASADWQSGEVSVLLIGYPPGAPQADAGRLWVSGDFGQSLRRGAAQAPEVMLVQGKDRDGPRLTSQGQTAELVIDTIGPARPDSYSRRVTGRIRARLCPQGYAAGAALPDCADLALRFDTDLQVSSTLPITP